MYRLWIWLSLLLLTSCAQVQFEQWDAHYGREQPKEMQITAPGPLTYYGNIKPLLDKRCVNCHGCYDAPCQLKQEAYAGLLRGANAQPVYGARLLAADPMRLFEDAQTTAQWRTNGFYPIFNERREEGANNVQLSLLAQTLLLKKAHPLPKGLLPDSFAIGLDAKHQCPRIETYQRFAKANPLAGMPYGLPGLKPAESKQLLDWVEQGAPMGTPPLLDNKIDKQVVQWEAFFNGPSLKHQLVSRYLYEHLFLAHIFFPDARGAHFRLVRSKTPPGEPIEQISTRRPYDDPQIARVY
ncbi:MAG: 9-hexadecenoic acid cis-trans isomerase, partial [Moraxellaceae bacterium]